MKTGIFGKIGWLVMLLFSLPKSHAQFIDKGIDRVKTPLQIPYKRIGTIQPRSTLAISGSRITVGCETMDRDYTKFNAYKMYLPPLGIKTIRLQAGWAKCEKVKGQYNFEWLDEIIDFALANHITPWLEASYGNPLYPGVDGKKNRNIMTTAEGYTAWDNWVEAMVTRYRNKVKDWEIWNEPDHPLNPIEPEIMARLNLRTANIIKRIQPEAKIAAMGMASNRNTDYLGRFLKVVADSGKLDFFKWISYHSYDKRPEVSYAGVATLQKELAKYSNTIVLRQGETGAPSSYIPGFAFSKVYWTEYTQAKYDLRRLLGDLGHNIESSVFTMIDIFYDYGNENSVLNMKGLIQSDTTKIAIKPKVAYYAMQNTASIFDEHLVVDTSIHVQGNGKKSYSFYGYTQQKNKNKLITFWRDDAPPDNHFETENVDLVIQNTSFKEPVWVDMITGNIYAIPAADWSKKGKDCYFKNIPVYDSPVLIAERKIVSH